MSGWTVRRQKQVLAALTTVIVVLLLARAGPPIGAWSARTATPAAGAAGGDPAVPDPPSVRVTWQVEPARGLFDREQALGSPRQATADSVRLEAIRLLRLHATIMADPPQALINGRIVEVGESIESFRVLEIGSRRVVLAKDGIHVELVP